MNRTSPRQAVAWAVALLCASMATAAPAQTAPSRSVSEPDNDADRLPAVQITGTALRRIDAETALPVIVIRRAEIDRSGARTTTELLQQLPAMQGVVPTSSVVGNDTRGYASVSIHDLGDAYTLVLLNGQRVAPFGGQLSSGALSGVDINTIPLAMVDRIEVLTDGASALYGADALGGVVNIITRRDGDANEASIGWTLPKGGAREWRASAFKSVGSLDEQRHNLSLGASIMHRSALRASERGYASQALINFEHGGQRYRYVDAQYNTAPANAYDFNDHAGNPYLLATGSCPQGQYTLGNGACLYNFAQDVDLVPEQRLESALASYTRLIGTDGKLQIDALLVRSRVMSHLAPAATSPSMPLFIPASSSLYSTYLTSLGIDQDPAYADYRFTDLGRRGFTDTSVLGDLAVRLEGRQEGWRWQGAFKHSVSRQNSDISQAMGTYAAQSLIDGGQFDPFVLTGQQSAAGMAALQRQTYNGQWLKGVSTLQEWQIQASKDMQTLPGGPLKLAVGANVRRERLNFSPSLFAQGLLSDPAAGTLANDGYGDLRLGDAFALVPSSASRWVWGAFAETLAPVTDKLDLGVALRTDTDSIVGQAWTGKANARWKVSPALMWRASVGTGFRAPTLNQLRSPTQSYGQTAYPYDCTAALQTQAVAVGATPCTSGSQSYAAVVSGNEQLQPEHSVQGAIGLRVEPLAGHTLGLDVWAVQIRNRIGSLDERMAFADPSAYARSWTTVQGNSGTELAYVGRPLNLGSLLSSGVDIDAGVRRGSSIGLIDSQLRATAILREDAQYQPGGPWYSAIGDGANGGATLKWRASWRNSLIVGGWTHSLTMRYQSGYEDAPADVQALDADGNAVGAPTRIRLRAPGQTLWDWQTSWRVDGNWQITAGVINLFNTKPPLSLNESGANKGQQLGYDERYYDARGRMLTLEARLSF